MPTDALMPKPVWLPVPTVLVLNSVWWRLVLKYSFLFSEGTLSESKLSNCLSFQSPQFYSWRTQTVTREAIRPANQSSL